MAQDVGLLILRVGVGLMMAGHGLGKVQNLLAGKTEFADPIGIGPFPSLVLAAFAEFVCALLVVVGFKTRWAAVPVVVTMLVAGWIVHGSDPWNRKEPALVFAVAFVAIAFAGGGRFALDSLVGRRKRRS